LSDLLNAITINKNHSEAILLIGYINIDLGEYKEAIKYFQKALNFKNYSNLAYRKTAFCHYKMKNFKIALDNYLKAIKIDQNDSESKFFIRVISENTKEGS